MFLLAAVESALCRLAIPCGSFRAFSLADTHHALIHHFVLLQVSAAEAHEAVRESVVGYQFKESFLRLQYLDTLSLDVGDGSGWVYRSIAVDGSVLDAAHPCKFQYHVGILAARIGDLDLFIFRHRLQ